jgi:hypothetical protein
MSRRFSAFLGCLLLPGVLSGQNSSSRPATTEEAVVYDRISHIVRFEDDGTGVQETTAVIRVPTQAGVKQLGQLAARPLTTWATSLTQENSTARCHPHFVPWIW